MITKPLYQEIASTLDAWKSCERSGNDGWLVKHADHIHDLVKEHMPSGGGFDNGVIFDFASTPEKLIFKTSFHHMDENGYYCRWTDHTIIVTPSLQHGFMLRVTGRDFNDIEEYIVSVFDEALRNDAKSAYVTVAQA